MNQGGLSARQPLSGVIEEEEAPQEDQANKTVELLSTIIQYVVNVKIDHIIKIMLEHHNTQSDGQLPETQVD